MVLEGWFSVVNTGNNNVGWVRVLRVLRVMRPLRTIKRFPQLRVLTTALMSSLDQLGHIFFLTLCIVSLFGVVGVLLWSGRFTGRCAPVDDETGEVLEPYTYRAPWDDTLYTAEVSGERLKLCNVRYEDEFEGCPLLKRVSSTGDTCRDSERCVDVGRNPKYNLISFDNIFSAMVMLTGPLPLKR